MPTADRTMRRFLSTTTGAASVSHYLSASSRARQPSPIRALQPLTSLPGMISLGSGMPSPLTFPIADINITMTGGENISLGRDLAAEALQYSATEGLPRLRTWILELQRREHGASADLMAVCVGTGSQSVLHLALDALLECGDTLLADAYAYPGALESVRPMGVHVTGVAMDGDGMLPEALEEALSSAARGGGQRRPKVLYTVPTGHNPCGCTMSNARRTRIYELCQAYGLVILEDDPYWFLHMDDVAATAAGDSGGIIGSARAGAAAHGGEELRSFLALDVESGDGRVLRFDSLSKVLSSGLRIGWATGSHAFIERLALHQQVASLHPSGLSQAVAASVLEHWDATGGWDAHVAHVQAFYGARRDAMHASATRHLSGLAQWKAPTAGMFFWLDLSLSGVTDTQRLVHEQCRDAKVLLVPGASFAVDREAPSTFCRAAFSMADEQAIDEGMRRLAAVLRA